MMSSQTLRVVEGAPNADGRPSPLPPAPRRPEDTGLSFPFLVELVMKVLLVHGEQRLRDLVDLLRLRPGVLLPVLTFIRGEALCEVARRGETEGTTQFNLTELGRARANDYMLRCQYAGVAPVALSDYVEKIESQSVAGMAVLRDQLHEAFADIVIQVALLDQFGAAMNSGRAIFVYGPAGSGKTFLVERLVRLLSGAVAVPHALAVNGEVIQVFDPLVHEPIEAPAQSGLDRGESGDARWVLCRRPVVMNGAELTLSMIDLEFDRRTRYYHAPQHLKANNGLFIIDDLGRQLVKPQELMDRWIVPLDRRVDYLTLHTGQKFCVPFDVIVVFSSNLRPSQLGEEAFLRRIGYKIFVGPLDLADYRSILQRECERLGVLYEEAGLDHLCRRHEAEGRPLLACQPRDILGQVRDYALFHGAPARMSPELLSWAWNNYFARE